MALTIDKGIPLAPRPAPRHNANRHNAKYPWREMSVGDSFLIPTQKTAKAFSASIAQAQRATGFKFASRTVEGGLRVWRTA